MADRSPRWFEFFLVESDGRLDRDVVWADRVDEAKQVRTPTPREKLSIIMIGVVGIGGIVVMIVTLLVAVYISRR